MAKKPELDDFRVPYFDAGKKPAPFDLASIDQASKPFSLGSKEEDGVHLAAMTAEIDKSQEKLHAQHKQRVLLILQGMDSSGKDGSIRSACVSLRSRRPPKSKPRTIFSGVFMRKCRPQVSSPFLIAAITKTCWCRGC
jgi:hypothetical protein